MLHHLCTNVHFSVPHIRGPTEEGWGTTEAQAMWHHGTRGRDGAGGHRPALSTGWEHSR